MNKKLRLIVPLFIVILIAFRLIWIDSNQSTYTVTAEKGVIDLRGMGDLSEDILLNGEWQFYAEEFITPGESSKRVPSLIQVPADWQEQFSGNMSYGYGTYRLNIYVDRDDTNIYRLYAKDIVSASRFFVNGEEKVQLGKTATNRKQEEVDYRPQTLQLESKAGEIELLIHVSNFHSLKTGGIIQPMKFGEWSAAEQSVFKEYGWQLALMSIICLHSVYSFLIYLLFSRRKEMLYLALSFLSVAIAIAIADDKLLLYFVPEISFATWSKMNILVYSGAAYLVVLYIRALVDTVKHPFGKKGRYYFRIIGIGYGIFVMLTLLSVEIDVLFLYALMILIPLPTPFLMYRLSKREKENFIFFLLAAISLMSSTIWGLYKAQVMPELPYYPYDMLISIILFGLFWFKRFFMETEKSHNLAASLQEEIQQKDEFLANTSHELRNPLHGILNITQTIYDSEQDKLSHETMRNLETLLSVGRQMTIILNDLLDRENLKDDKFQLDHQDVKILAVLTSVFDTLKFMKEGKSVSLEHSIPIQYPDIKADENRLYQILFNLVHNAIKFSTEGTVHVSAEVQNKMAVIRVSDEGIGMSPEDAKIIFKPYKQAESGITSTGGGGLGLGLSICKQLIELHGGEIRVETKEDEGTTFTFTLPLSENQQQKGYIPVPDIVQQKLEPADSVTFSASNATERILVVDDDPMNLQIIKQMLKADGYMVVTCTSANEALKELERGRWSLVISDVMMPYMSGYELTRELRKRFSLAELPILLLTARTQQIDIQMGFEAGANDYVRKPVEKVELIMRVRALTNLNQTIAELIQMEAAWLQAQIHPHFLFNTLNTISALSEIDPEKMVKLLDKFGTYLEQNFTIQNLASTVSLKKELELVEAFVYIEKQRYGDRLQVEMDIAPVQVEVPPLSIQTLVENAIEHGVLKRPEGGTVWIKVSERDDAVEISISDNGLGMEQDLVTLMQDNTNIQAGVGLPNTHKRLRQLGYSGLTIDSIPNIGTVIRFSIDK
ncbi:histidine kinase [Sporosarcina sp. P20a]|uniref:hybrid sensor histidine kinase/response regulator n=1 Tax=Sporosarcina sp. P20a TaxID=2048256 RepID=UPI000C1738E4|nr:ATP-binding protein [Sporosarcina sp. P20a]PIC86977.1 histidine kinase [Sporosarcina sp. P20a]